LIIPIATPATVTTVVPSEYHAMIRVLANATKTSREKSAIPAGKGYTIFQIVKVMKWLDLLL